MSSTMSDRNTALFNKVMAKKLTQLQRRIAKTKRVPEMAPRTVGWTDRVKHVSSKSRLEDITPMKVITINAEIIESNGEVAFMLYEYDKEIGFVLFVEETEICLAMDIDELVQYYATSYPDKLTQIIEWLEQLAS